MKIIRTADSGELSKSELSGVEELGAEYFVYNYQTGDYEGHGWAVWKLPDGKFGYTDLGHCSCYGPVEDLKSIPYTLDEIKLFAEKNYGEYASPVIEIVELVEGEQ